MIFALFTYWDSQTYPDLIAQIHPSRTILVSPEGVQDLTVYANGHLIKGPVTSVQVSIWNAGTKPIRADDVLEKIEIRTDKPLQVLSARILKTNRKITNFEADISKASQGIIGVNFKILEKDDSALLQITYEGDDKINFIGTGSIVGQNKFEVTTLNRHEEKVNHIYHNTVTNKIFLVFFMAVMIFFLFRLIPAYYRDVIRTKSLLFNPEASKISKAVSCFGLFFGLGLLFFFVYMMLGTVSSIPIVISPYLAT